jgi:hypothetical protein
MPAGRPISNQLLKQCETEMTNRSIDFQVCKIEKNKIIFLTEQDLNTAIKPSDSFILSINLSKIISQKVTTTNPISVCAVLYPILVPSHLENKLSDLYPSSQQINDIFKQYQTSFKWYSNTTLELVQPKNLANMVCSKPFQSENAKVITFVISLPQSTFFNSVITAEGGKMDLDIQNYGVKLLLANATFIQNQTTSDNVNIAANIFQNYAQMIPVGIFRHNINLRVSDPF